MKVLVTGGAGFIGTHLVEALRRRGDCVVVVDRRPQYPLAPTLDVLRTEPNLLGGIDLVYHLAGQPGVADSFNRFGDYVRDNVWATDHLLKQCLTLDRPPRVIVASSSSVHSMLSPYAASKAACERVCEVYHNLGLKIRVLRLFTVYGPGQRPDMAFARWFDAIRRGEPITVYGRWHRDFTYIDDVVTALISHGDEPYWFGAGPQDVGYAAPVDADTVIETMAAVVQCDPCVHRLPARPGDPTYTRAQYPIPCTVGLHEGLRRQWEAR